MSLEPWMIVAGSVLGMLVSLVLMVVFFIHNKLKAGFFLLALFFVFLFSLCYGIYKSISKTFDNLMMMGENLGHKFDSTLTTKNNFYYRPELLDSIKPNPHVLQMLACHDDSAGIIQKHYIHFGSMVHSRLPLPYPYALIIHENYQSAEVVKETGSESGIAESEEKLFLGVNYVAFDCRFLIICTSNQINEVLRNEKSEEIKYIIYTFGTGKSYTFADEKRMWEKARQINFSGEKKLLNLDEYNALFYDTKQ